MRLPQQDWARKRLLVVRLMAQHEHTVAEIMKIAGVCRRTVFTYRDKVMAEGEVGLLKRDLRVVSLPPYFQELNLAEWFGRVVKAPKVNRIYKSQTP